MIQFRLDNRYVSELDKLLKEKRNQYPAHNATDLQKKRIALHKLPAEDIPFSLKKR